MPLRIFEYNNKGFLNSDFKNVIGVSSGSLKSFSTTANAQSEDLASNVDSLIFNYCYPADYYWEFNNPYCAQCYISGTYNSGIT